MKQLMIDIMAAMMPYMKPIAYIGTAMAVGGLVAAVAGMRGSLTAIAATVAIGVGLFFIACEVMGNFLELKPTMLFADPADRAMYRNQWPFWIVGAAIGAAGFVVRMLGRRSAG